MKHKNSKKKNIVEMNQRLSKENVGQEESVLDPLAGMEQKIRQHRHQFWSHFLSTAAMILLVLAATYFLIEYETYGNVKMIGNVNIDGAGNSSYVEFADGMLQYNKDGISYIDLNAKERWNQPCQIQNPIADTNKTAAVVADKGGNDIIVLEKKGLKGEIHTNLPIEKVSVSGQGIVCAILKDGSSPRVMCYDAAGNVIAEQKVSVAAVGYPMAVAISEDGYTMAVSYLQFTGGSVSSKVSYYNLKNAEEGETDHPVNGKDYPDEVIPTVFFMDNQTSAAVGDQTLLIYSGSGTPELDAKITVSEEIKSVVHSDKYIGLIVKNNEGEGDRIRLYNKGGKLVMTEQFTGDYSNVKISGNHIMLYDGKKCSVFKKSGVHKFEGELPKEIKEIMPLSGINKYAVITADGLTEIRLTK